MFETTRFRSDVVSKSVESKNNDAISNHTITKNVFFSLIRYEMTGEAPEKMNYDPQGLYLLAERHDMGHLIADALKKNYMLPYDKRMCARFQSRWTAAVYRTSKIEYTIPIITAALEQAAIPYILLKGAHLYSLYPEFWMRTSCDIDLLVHEEQLDEAVNTLVAAGFSTNRVHRSHDVLLSFDDVDVELHYTVCGNIPTFNTVLSQIWDYAEPLHGFEYKETPTFFAFDHIAHMARHFMAGGCGIRPVLDLWLLRKNACYDEQSLLPMLDKAFLTTFYKTMCALSDYWFDKGDSLSLPPMLEEYILSGGAYGTLKNNYAISTMKANGKIRYLISIAFPPVSSMKRLYPMAENFALLPLCYIHRFFSKCFANEKKHIIAKIHTIAGQNKDKIRELEALFQSVGLTQARKQFNSPD